MKVLRIKKKIDLKELLKYGFEYKKNEDNYEWYEYEREMGVVGKWNEYITIPVFNREIVSAGGNLKLFELIQAGLVEEAEEEEWK